MDNSDQREFWTETAGAKWVANQPDMDALMQPVLDGVLARAAIAPGNAVLDIGCGTGASCLAASRAAGPEGSVTGVDISPTLLELGRRRCAHLPNVTLMEADAGAHDFTPA